MSESDTTASASYAEIVRLVAAKSLSITFIFGPPRGGTTAAERWMYDSFNFDGNVNQPGLMARDEVGNRDRIEATWATVLSKYNNVSNDKPKGYNIRLIVKETSNVVLPQKELGLWQRIESRICCILNRISSGATADLGVGPDLDPRTATIGGHPLVLPTSDFSCLDESNKEVSLWQQYYKHMKKTRDYTSLGQGFVIFSTLHPLFEEPEIQEEALKLYQRNHQDDETISDEEIQQCIGAKLEDIANLPSFFHSAFHAWRFGWAEFTEQVDVLYGNIHKSGYCSNIGLVDMSDLQSSPKYFFAKLKPLVGYVPLLPKEQVESPKQTQDVAGVKVYQEFPEPIGGGEVPQSDGFDVSSQGAAWDMWFLSSCNWDSIDATSDIRPPTKSIVQYGNFPPFLANEVKYGLLNFCALKKIRLGIDFQVPIDVLREFYGVDVAQDYINEALFFHVDEMHRVKANTNFFGYLPLIKESLIKCGITLPLEEADLLESLNEMNISGNKNNVVKILNSSRQRSGQDCQPTSNP